MLTHLELYKSIMFRHKIFSREFMEMIAVVVSKVNNCNYCVNHHAEALNHYWKDEARVKFFIDDYKNLELEEKYNLLLNYAVILTKTLEFITQAPIDELKKKWME